MNKHILNNMQTALTSNIVQVFTRTSVLYVVGEGALGQAAFQCSFGGL
jgi:hypothetical protein